MPRFAAARLTSDIPARRSRRDAGLGASMSVSHSVPQGERRALLDTMWDTALFGMCLVREDGTFIRANKAFCDIVEYTEAELELRTFSDITIPDDVSPDLEMAARVKRGDIESYDMIKHYLTKTRRIVRITLRVNAIRRDDGTFDYYFSQIAPAHVAQPSATKLQVTSGIAALAFWRKNWPTISAWVAAIAMFLTTVLQAFV